MHDPQVHHTDPQFIASMTSHCELLRQIQESYPLTPAQRDAVLVSAKAILYSMSFESFRQYLIDFNKPVSKEQLAHLKQLGITDYLDPNGN